MTVIEPQIRATGPKFEERRASMLSLVEDVRALEAGVQRTAEKARARREKKGLMMPRDRVARLLDPGSDFVELSTLAGLRMHDDDGKRSLQGGGNIVGIGFVAGVRCLINASEAAIKGGSVTPMGLKKSLRAQQIALEQRLPMVSLIESGGANLLFQSEIFVDGGRFFANMARLSAAGIPQITVVHGSSTAGGAYMPGLSDYVVMVEEHAKVFLAGPPLVQAALGECSTEQELGGAAMHGSIAGTAEYLAADDAHALQLARQIVDQLDWNRTLAPGRGRPGIEPRHDPDELAGVVPTDARTPYDVHEVLARLVDDSKFLEFKPDFGSQTVCGHARIQGRSVGILGNNGPIFPQGSVKAAQFIQACQQSNLPLIFLMNTTGYMVGKAAEQAGAVKHGSKMIQAVANATVPKITIVLGGAYGAGYYGMCGRGFDPDFLFAWPTAKLAVMGGEQAATVMKIITAAKLARHGMPANEEALESLSSAIRDKLDQEATALFATARVWDDGLIDPRHTRTLLAFCLDTCDEARRRTLHPSTFGVARG